MGTFFEEISENTELRVGEERLHLFVIDGKYLIGVKGHERCMNIDVAQCSFLTFSVMILTLILCCMSNFFGSKNSIALHARDNGANE